MSQSPNELSALGHSLRLARGGDVTQSSLRAWDAADEYLLAELEATALPRPGTLLIVSDAFGALTTALAGLRPVSLFDSAQSLAAARQNLAANHPPAVVDACQLATMTDEVTGRFDVCLMKAPKNLSLLEAELARVHALLAPDGRVLTGAMVKHLTPRVTTLLEAWIGPTEASLARKKARLLRSRRDGGLTAPPPPAAARYQIPEYGLTIVGEAGVFSREKLDIGSRFFLPFIPATRGQVTILDLGAGSGVLAARAAQQNQDARIIAVDESCLALRSTAQTFAANHLAAPELLWACSLDALPSRSVDLVVCNPPFHEGTAITRRAAKGMFYDARRVLRPGGELRVVANRHLGYHVLLGRLFREVRQLGANPKFVVFACVKA